MGVRRVSRLETALLRVRHCTMTPAAILAATGAYIVRHPANRAHPVRALLGALRAWWSYRRTGTPLRVPLGERSQLVVRPRLLSFGESVALYGNPPDYWESTLLVSILRPGDLFVDIGANAGIYTLLAVETGADVIALEPGTAARSLLLENLDLNGCRDAVHVHAAAAGRERGTAQVTDGTHVLNHVIDPSVATPPVRPVFALARATGSELVDVVTVDEIVGDREVAAIKIDVEGFEQSVLEGLPRALREHRVGYLQVENNGLSMAHYGRSTAPIWAMLRSYGYSLHRLTRHGALVAQQGDPAAGEVIAVAPTDFFWTRLRSSRWPGPLADRTHWENESPDA
jgi:FkbM family methyltransferase